MISLGEKLRKLRKERGLKQTELAASLPIKLDRSLLSRFEADQRVPSWETMCALAQFYDVPLDYFLAKPVPALKGFGEFIDDPTELALIHAWRVMDYEEKTVFVMMADRMRRSKTSVA
ncbi:helix-turn-helix transcriptional regulator [Acetobacteraceae bacterium ESL0709]|nr:helix-turn-helix transcriptional regulator [Acetobacteraceae bacterium ESL0697]MDF7678920.1 helix-turn-helix transcriptional regulator [Acetobacteraceae bacterium ESL0709]